MLCLVNNLRTSYRERRRTRMNNLQHNSESQQLTVSLEIPIPSDLVIISKVELQELKQKELKGLYWTMKDLEKRINRKHEWIKENILYPSRLKDSRR